MSLALGAYGWHRTFQKALGHVDGWEVLEHTLDLIHADVVEVVELKFQQHWTLKVAKFATKILLAIALVETGLLVFRQQVRLWLFRLLKRRSTGHLVVMGLGDHGRQLLHEAAAREGCGWVAGIDLHDDAPGAGEARQAERGVFVHGNGEDAAVLAAAAVERAGRVVILAGTDDTNVRLAAVVARHAADRGGRPQVIVGLSSSAILEGIRDRLTRVLGAPRGAELRLVNFRAVALRAILRELAERFVRRTRGAQAIRVLVAAPPPFAADFLRAAIPFLQVSGEARPCFVVCGHPGAEQSFHRHHPEAARVAEVRWVDIPPGEAGLAQELEGQVFDVALVGQDQAVGALHAAELCLGSNWFRVEHVYAVLPQEPPVETLADGRLTVRSIFTLGRACEEFGHSGSLEAEARANHEAYLAGLEPESRAGQRSWEELEESRKESNRWAVLSRQIKRAQWEATTEEERGAATLEHLAISEHQRWMAEKVMGGWRFGTGPDGRQDGSRRLHPDLQPWAALGEDTREKDRVQVRKALEI